MELEGVVTESAGVTEAARSNAGAGTHLTASCCKCGGGDIHTLFYREGAEVTRYFHDHNVRWLNIPQGCYNRFGILEATADVLVRTCRTCRWWWTEQPRVRCMREEDRLANSAAINSADTQESNHGELGNRDPGNRSPSQQGPADRRGSSDGGLRGSAEGERSHDPGSVVHERRDAGHREGADVQRADAAFTGTSDRDAFLATVVLGHPCEACGRPPHPGECKYPLIEAISARLTPWMPDDKYLRPVLLPIVNDAFKRARRDADMTQLPQAGPFVDAIIATLKRFTRPACRCSHVVVDIDARLTQQNTDRAERIVWAGRTLIDAQAHQNTEPPREPETLTFGELRRKNAERRDLLLRAKKPDFRVEDAWSLNDWMTALVGEIGEAANLLKKVHRGDYTLDAIRGDLADEIADVQTYLDLLASVAGIDLGAATVAKWNRVSQRIDCPLRLETSPRVAGQNSERAEPTRAGGE